MALSNELVSQLVKVVSNRGSANTDYTVYGTIVESGGQKYVQFDGSDINTPFESTIEVNENDRVIVEVKGHTATVTGSPSNQSLGRKYAEGVESLIKQLPNAITLAVKQSYFDPLNTAINGEGGLEARLKSAESSIKLLPNAIESSVKGTYFDPLNTAINGEGGIADRLVSAESTIKQMPDSIVSTVKGTYIDPINGKITEFSTFKQNFDSFEFITEGGKVKIASGNLQLTGAISFSDLSDYSAVNTRINTAATDASDAVDYAIDAAIDAEDALDYAAGAYSLASGTDSTLTKLLSKTDTSTYIDGSKILANSIYANKIHLGGWMKVYTTQTGTTAGGWIGYSSGFNSTSGIAIMSGANASSGSSSEGQCVCTDQAARLSFGNNPQVVVSKDKSVVATGASVKLTADGGSNITTNPDNGYISLVAAKAIQHKINGKFLLAAVNDGSTMTYRPHYDITNSSTKISTLHLGHSSYKFKSLFVDAVSATTCSGTTSDRNEKNSIENLPDKYLTLFDSLRPVRYKLDSGSSGRYHVGYIAQEVEEAMANAGIDSSEFGGFIKDAYEDGSEYYMLRYGEFDGIRDAKIKQLEARLAAIEERIKS